MTDKTEKYLDRIKEHFGDRYDYSAITKINNQHEKVPIVCKKHDRCFYSYVHGLIEGRGGCPECKKETLRNLKQMGSEKFIELMNEKFGDVYELKSLYINNHTEVDILCKKCGRVFRRKPKNILNGIGCTYCESSILETTLRKALENEHIEFISQARFNWLGRKSLDFYIPSIGIAIECQGDQHFIPKGFYGGEIGLQKIMRRDNDKYHACKNHNIRIVYFAGMARDKYHDIIFTDIDEIIKFIKEYRRPL